MTYGTHFSGSLSIRSRSGCSWYLLLLARVRTLMGCLFTGIPMIWLGAPGYPHQRRYHNSSLIADQYLAISLKSFGRKHSANVFESVDSAAHTSCHKITFAMATLMAPVFRMRRTTTLPMSHLTHLHLVKGVVSCSYILRFPHQLRSDRH